MKSFKKLIRDVLQRYGYDLVKFKPRSHPLARRKKILETYGISTLLDVGANTGQYGAQLREIGYRGKIISFEPLSSAFARLTERAAHDPSWELENYALGDKEETAVINVAANSFSSSLLDMLPSHLKSAPKSEYIGKEEIKIKTLDSIFSSLSGLEGEVYLKIDTQGFEKRVLKGGEKSLQDIDTIQLEMSLVPLYEDELPFIEMYQYLYEKGYTLIAVEPGFTDPTTGQLLQLDGIFHRI